jgi:hypothetical protein
MGYLFAELAQLVVVWKFPRQFERVFAGLVTGSVGAFADAMANRSIDDPVYKKNLQRLIERNRSFEETKE